MFDQPMKSVMRSLSVLVHTAFLLATLLQLLTWVWFISFRLCFVLGDSSNGWILLTANYYPKYMTNKQYRVP